MYLFKYILNKINLINYIFFFYFIDSKITYFPADHRNKLSLFHSPDIPVLILCDSKYSAKAFILHSTSLTSPYKKLNLLN